MLSTKGINYNESHKIKKMFLIADFINFVSSVHFRLLFPWVQCQSLKPVLSQSCQTGFVTVDDFIALYTCSYVFYSNGSNVFIVHARTVFTLADTIGTNFYSDNRSLALCYSCHGHK